MEKNIQEAELGVQLLQRDLNPITSASLSWNLRLNPDKCMVMRFSQSTWWRESGSESVY